MQVTAVKTSKGEQSADVLTSLGHRPQVRLRGSWLVGIAVVLFITNLFPLIKLAQRSLITDGRFTLEHIAWVIQSSQVRTALVNSLFTSGVSTLVAVTLAVPLAALTIKADLPGRNFIRLAILSPLVIPPHILAISWQQWAGPVGYLQRAIRSLFDLFGPLWTLYGPGGIILLLSFFSLPIAYLTVAAGLARIPRSVEEAAMCEGASTGQVWRYIILPLVRPHIVAAVILALLNAMGNFGIPALLGIPAQYTTLPTLIYRQVASLSTSSFGRSASLGLLFGLPVLAVLLVQSKIVHRAEQNALGDTGESGIIYRLGRWRRPVQALLLALIVLCVGGPLFSVAVTGLIRAYGVPLTWENLTLDHVRFVLFELDRVRVATRNSLLLASGAALACSVLGAVIGYVVVRARTRWIQAIVNLPYALPGIVFALALILVWIVPPIPGVKIYGTLGIIFIAYLGRFLALAVQPIAAGWQQVDPSIEEAAKVDGAGFWQALIYVLAPVIAPSLGVGALLVFLQALVELTLSALLAGSGTETLGWLIFGLEQGGYTTHSAALSTVLLIALLLFAGLLGLLRRREAS